MLRVMILCCCVFERFTEGYPDENDHVEMLADNYASFMESSDTVFMNGILEASIYGKAIGFATDLVDYCPVCSQMHVTTPLQHTCLVKIPTVELGGKYLAKALLRKSIPLATP